MGKVSVKLMYPNVAVDEYGNEGFWTIIYNQVFNIVTILLIRIETANLLIGLPCKLSYKAKIQ